MDMPELMWTTMSIACGYLAFTVYIMQMYGKEATTPHQGGWIAIAGMNLITCAAQVIQGTAYPFQFLTTQVGGTLAIAVLAVWRSNRGWSRGDTCCAVAMAAAGFLAWNSQSAQIATLSVLAVHATAIVTMLTKTLRNPYSEKYPFWVVAALGNVCDVMASNQPHDSILYTAPILLALMYSLVPAALAYGRWRYGPRRPANQIRLNLGPKVLPTTQFA